MSFGSKGYYEGEENYKTLSFDQFMEEEGGEGEATLYWSVSDISEEDARKNWHKAILIHTLSEKCQEKFICVRGDSIHKYLSGEEFFADCWTHFVKEDKPKEEEKKTVSIEEAIKLIADHLNLDVNI